MLNFIKNFRNDEDGAVTVDWVVLTAAVVLLGALVGGFVKDGASVLSAQIGTEMVDESTKLAANP